MLTIHRRYSMPPCAWYAQVSGPLMGRRELKIVQGSEPSDADFLIMARQRELVEAEAIEAANYAPIEIEAEDGTVVG